MGMRLLPPYAHLDDNVKAATPISSDDGDTRFAEDVMLAKNAGMNEHMAKPLDINKLNDTSEKMAVILKRYELKEVKQMLYIMRHGRTDLECPASKLPREGQTFLLMMMV